MCIIGFQPEGTDRIPKHTLSRCRRANSDGMGIMYPQGDRLEIFKGLDNARNFEELWNRYTSARDRGVPVGIHFRIATHGGVTEENCHPFYVYEDYDGFAFMHNGTIRDLGDYDRESVSDTRAFAQKVLRELPGNFLHSTALRSMIEGFIGYSKLLFMDAEGGFDILNEGKGWWDDGVWWSNRGYLPANRRAHNNRYNKSSLVTAKSTVEDDDEDDEKEADSYENRTTDHPLSARELATGDKSDGEKWHDFLLDSKQRDELRENPPAALEIADPSFLEILDSQGEVQEAEANEYGLLFNGSVICYGCLPDDVDDDEPMFFLPEQEDIVYQCQECRAILNKNYYAT